MSMLRVLPAELMRQGHRRIESRWQERGNERSFGKCPAYAIASDSPRVPKL